MSTLRPNPILSQAGNVTIQNPTVKKITDRASFLFIAIIILCFYKIVSHKNYNDSEPNEQKHKSVLGWIILLFVTGILYYYFTTIVEILGFFIGFFTGSNTVTVGTGGGYFKV